MLQMQSCYMDLSKLLHGFVKWLHGFFKLLYVFLALCHTKPSWCLTNILKLFVLTSVSCLAIHNSVQKSSFHQTLSRLCDDDTGVWTKDVKRYSMPGSVVHLAKFLKCDIYLVRIFISPKAIQLHIYLAYLEHYLTGAREREWSIWRECFCFWQYFCDDHCQRPELKMC